MKLLLLKEEDELVETFLKETKVEEHFAGSLKIKTWDRRLLMKDFTEDIRLIMYVGSHKAKDRDPKEAISLEKERCLLRHYGQHEVFRLFVVVFPYLSQREMSVPIWLEGLIKGGKTLVIAFSPSTPNLETIFLEITNLIIANEEIRRGEWYS